MIKMEEDVGEGRGEEAGTGRALRRRLDEGGAAVQDETRLLRAHAEAQALAIQGMEQTRVIGEQLVQAKSRIAELTAEMKIKDAVMQEKERIIHSKDVALQSKDVALQEKVSHFGKLIKCKDELLQLEDAEIRRLQADLARLSSEVAAGGAALHPAPARAAAAADAAAAVGGGDDGVGDACISSDGALPPPLLLASLRRSCAARACVPVLLGAALRNRGVQPLLDAVVDILPSPSPFSHGTAVAGRREHGARAERKMTA